MTEARIDEATKSESAAVLAAMGLTLSDAFRMLVKRAECRDLSGELVTAGEPECGRLNTRAVSNAITGKKLDALLMEVVYLLATVQPAQLRKPYPHSTAATNGTALLGMEKSLGVL